MRYAPPTATNVVRPIVDRWGQSGPPHPNWERTSRTLSRIYGDGLATVTVEEAAAREAQREAEADAEAASHRWFAWGDGYWSRFADEAAAERAVARVRAAFPDRPFKVEQLGRPGSMPDCSCCHRYSGRLHDGDRLPWEGEA